ncbi:MAG: DUF4129 domain-containing protein [Granulosicoccaceae bacterium]|jgi:hypothetical protein
MKPRLTLLLGGLFTTLWLSVAQAGDSTTLLNSLNSCINSRFTGNETAVINDSFELDSECPALAGQYPSHTWLQQLQPGLRNETSLNQLLDIRALLQQQQQHAQHSSRSIDRNYLQELRAELEFNSAAEEPGLWQRFINWLKEKYKDEQDEENNIDWLLDLLEGNSLPDWLGKVIFYVSMVVIIILALFIVINEIRAARRPGARRRRLQRHQGGRWAEDLPVLELLNWEQIGRLPTAQQPGAILRFIIDYFIDQGWLDDDRSRTNREMWRELRASHQSAANAFNNAINLSERAIYGDHPLGQEQLRELYATAQRLTGAGGKA